MTPNDKQGFAELLTTTHTYYRADLTPGVIGLWWAALEKFDLHDIRKAISAHICDGQAGTFTPKISQIIKRIDAATPGPVRISADEAWAIAVRASDETDTVVWNNLISEAWGVVQPVYEAGDEIGARMAFRATYERLLTIETDVKWWVSPGSNADLRSARVREAVDLGRLPKSIAEKFLQIAPTNGFAGLIASAKDAVHRGKTDANAIAALQGIRLGLSRAPGTEEAILAREKTRQEFEQHRNAELERLEQRIREAESNSQQKTSNGGANP